MRCTVVIAAHNEGPLLERTVEAALRSAGAMACELLVVDDCSQDGSLQRMAERFDGVRVIPCPVRHGASATKALGGRHAGGDVLVFLDGHCKAEGTAIRRLVEDVELTGGDAVVTPAIPVLDPQRWENSTRRVGHGYEVELSRFDCAWRPLGSLEPCRVAGRRFHVSPAAIGCALAVSWRLYEQVWGFDPDMRLWGIEDLDFSLKCWLAGGAILHDPEAVVGHHFRNASQRYGVPRAQVVANELRMARKNFNEPTWMRWAARCRGRCEHADPSRRLWTDAWSRFRTFGPSVEREREALAALRKRDAHWYARCFGVNGP